METFEEEEREEELREKTSFFWEWFAFCVLIIGLSLIVILVASWYTGWFWLSGLLIVPVVVCAGIIFKHRYIVDQKHAVVYEWRGERVEPLVPGMYFPFPFFGFLSEGVEVPTNPIVLNIFTGSRDGLVKAEKYYGSQEDVQPETGAAIRLAYDITLQIVDPNKFVYSFDNCYAQIASLVEKEVMVYVHNNEAEKIYDNFTKENWQELVVDKLSATVETMGVILISFIPKGIKDNPEVEADRLKVEKERRRGEVLEKQLKNQEIVAKIEQKNNEIRQEQIASIMKSSGCSAAEALNFLNREKTLETVKEAAKDGHLTFMDASGNGTLSQSAALGYGLNMGRGEKS
jgi:regulator of protease activity HflC (stomatin/prohibitin superfamily)